MASKKKKESEAVQPKSRKRKEGVRPLGQRGVRNQAKGKKYKRHPNFPGDEKPAMREALPYKKRRGGFHHWGIKQGPIYFHTGRRRKEEIPEKGGGTRV